MTLWFEWLGQRIAVKGLETFDSVRGLKYLGMVYPRHQESDQGNRRRHKRNQWTRQDNEYFAPLWAKHNGSSELDLTCCSQGAQQKVAGTS